MDVRDETATLLFPCSPIPSYSLEIRSNRKERNEYSIKRMNTIERSSLLHSPNRLYVVVIYPPRQIMLVRYNRVVVNNV